MPADTLVIGFGNTLRGDDGIGPAVAEEVAALGMSRVRVIMAQQLTPELATDLTDARLAVFIDAAVKGDPITAVRIGPASTGEVMTHSATPSGLLALCKAVYGRCPEAWLVTAVGADFNFRDELSPAGRKNAREALGFVERLIREAPGA